jgi:hypothetical protein
MFTGLKYLVVTLSAFGAALLSSREPEPFDPHAMAALLKRMCRLAVRLN